MIDHMLKFYLFDDTLMPRPERGQGFTGMESHRLLIEKQNQEQPLVGSALFITWELHLKPNHTLRRTRLIPMPACNSLGIYCVCVVNGGGHETGTGGHNSQLHYLALSSANGFQS